jgi:hypothetical protein
MTRIVSSWSVVFLMAVALIGQVSAETPTPPTPEEPPKFAVLKAADQQLLTLVYWKPVIEITGSGPPKLVNQPREFTIEQSKVVGRTVAGQSLDNAEAWQDAVGSAMVLVPHDTTIDDVYTKALNPAAVLIQPKEAVAKETPALYPDGTAPQNATPGGNPVSQPGAPSPQEVAAAQQAIAPEVAKLKLKIAPAPIINPVINQALPGYMFFPVPSDSDADDNGGKGKRRPVRIIIKKPDGSVETVDRNDDDEKNSGRIFDLLRDQMTVLTPADARKYARVHLLLAGARHSKYTFGPINSISVTSTASGGLSVYAEMPITGGATGPKSSAFTLTANFGKNGKVLGGMRGRR